MLGVGHVVTSSVGMCDIDIRPVSKYRWPLTYDVVFVLMILSVGSSVTRNLL